ncbi:MAG TPA: ankyrin repeat domain-containing protein, partial [Kofleriaceae bacterium]|nr:ankyrin repeat domain-containing protein [Kofleriaceae bacterium]
ELLDRPVIRDPSFRAAVTAIHRGDVAGLERLLDAEPRLLRERIAEPDCYREAGRPQYFRDPKLFWFIANNPTLMEAMPPSLAEIARAMIARGVAREDLDYTLALLMTSAPAREQGFQGPLARILLEAGAVPTEEAILTTLGHRELAPVELLLERGHPMTAAIAAGLGREDRLGELLAGAPPEEVQTALGMAVINGHVRAARMALDAGADPDAFLPVHSHSVPLHQAALDENLELIDLLLSRGARADVRDKLWNGTPRDWAVHAGKQRSVARLDAVSGPAETETGPDTPGR